MVEFINTVLSYDFIPKIIELLKDVAIYSAIGMMIFFALSVVAMILKGTLQKIFTYIGMGVLICTCITLFIAVVCIIMIPTIFCIISLKIGFMNVFGWTEILSGIIATLGCICILSLIGELGSQ